MKRFVIILIALAFCWSAAGQDNAFEHQKFTSTDGTDLNYRLLKPELQESIKQYPLVIFLHGAGERGNDNEAHLVHGSQMFLNPVNREKYPAYVLFPQCPKDGFWAYRSQPEILVEMTAEEKMPPIFNAVKELIDTYLKREDIDKRRIYIMGISMGAMGTYDMVARFPEIFAAAIPICGSVKSERLANIKDVKFRIYHGDADEIVPVEGSRNAYRALKKAGVDVELFEFPGCGHLSWNPAFSSPGFMEWLFAQKKSN